VETRGTKVNFGAFGLKSVSHARITSNQIEAARKAIKRHIGKTGKL
jgi:large subunit ribosomal protein L16